MIEFVLPNLSCGHCVRAVTQAAQGVDPQARVAVELEGRRVRIDSLQPDARFRQALAEAGYPVAQTVDAGGGTAHRDAGAAASV